MLDPKGSNITQKNLSNSTNLDKTVHVLTKKYNIYDILFSKAIPQFAWSTTSDASRVAPYS